MSRSIGSLMTSDKRRCSRSMADVVSFDEIFRDDLRGIGGMVTSSKSTYFSRIAWQSPSRGVLIDQAEFEQDLTEPLIARLGRLDSIDQRLLSTNPALKRISPKCMRCLSYEPHVLQSQVSIL